MRRSCVVLMLIAASTAAAAATPDICDTSYTLTGASPSPILTTAQINGILQVHNDARRNVVPYAKYMPMLKWDQTLANFAQEYIGTCPGLNHSAYETRMNATKFGFWYVGENIAAGLDMSGANGNLDGPKSAVKIWIDESRYFDYDVNECTNDMECRHYTQAIWADTTHVGCGWSSCPNDLYKNYWSCVYGVGGNFVGMRPFQTTSFANSAPCTAARPWVPEFPTSPPLPSFAPDACDASYQVTAVPQGAALNVAQVNGILKAHNDARRDVYPYAKEMPMLQWSDKLAEFAQEYIDTCPGLVHSSANHRQNEAETGFWYVGENLAGGPWLSGPEGGAAAVNLWNNERSAWTFPQTCIPGKDCWHYTQNVWADTTHVGCGYKQCNDDLQYYYNCVYGVGGNMVGADPYAQTTVLSESATCTRGRGAVAVMPATPTAPPMLPADTCESSYFLTAAPEGAQLGVNQINGILKAHNDARRNVNPMAKVMPMLQWDQKLASFAQNYVSTCPGLVHSSADARQNMTATGYWYVGENLAAGTNMGGEDGGVLAVNAWVNERPNWLGGMSCKAGTECWHFTQVVWAESTHVGCARQQCPGSQYRFYWSCVYGVGGNFLSESPYVPTTDDAQAATCTRRVPQ